MVQCAKCSSTRATAGCSRSPAYCTTCCRQYAAELTVPCVKHRKRPRQVSEEEEDEDTDVPVGAQDDDGKEEKDESDAPAQQQQSTAQRLAAALSGFSEDRLLALLTTLSPPAAASSSSPAAAASLRASSSSSSSSPAGQPPAASSSASSASSPPAHFPALGLGAQSQAGINALISDAVSGTASVSPHNTTTSSSRNALQDVSHGLRPIAPGEGIDPLEFLSEALTRTYKERGSKVYKTVDELKKALLRYVGIQAHRLDPANITALFSYVVETLQYAQAAGVELATTYHLETIEAVQHKPSLYDPLTAGPTFWPAYHRILANRLQSTSTASAAAGSTASSGAPAAKVGIAKRSPKKRRVVVQTCRIHGAGHSNADCNRQKADKGDK